MPPSVRGKINVGIGGYDVSVAVKVYEGQEGVQHLLLVIIYSLYNVTHFGCGQLTV